MEVFAVFNKNLKQLRVDVLLDNSATASESVMIEISKENQLSVANKRINFWPPLILNPTAVRSFKGSNLAVEGTELSVVIEARQGILSYTIFKLHLTDLHLI